MAVSKDKLERIAKSCDGSFDTVSLADGMLGDMAQELLALRTALAHAWGTLDNMIACGVDSCCRLEAVQARDELAEILKPYEDMWCEDMGSGE